MMNVIPETRRAH